MDVSLAQGCVGGSHMDDLHDSSSERSSQSLSPSQTQLLLMHFPKGKTQKYIKLSNLIEYLPVSILILPKEIRGYEGKNALIQERQKLRILKKTLTLQLSTAITSK